MNSGETSVGKGKSDYQKKRSEQTVTEISREKRAGCLTKEIVL
jgi:hypothetical protein